MASGEITSTFTKLWYSSRSNSSDGAEDFVNGESYYYNSSSSSYYTVSFHGANFEAIRGLPNLKITGFSFKINCGRYNTGSGSKAYFSYRLVSGMESDSNNYDTSITNDAVTVVSGSVARTDYYFTQDDLPEVLTWMQANTDALLNGYTTGSFGFRTYCRYAQMRAAELTLYYSYDISVTGVTVSPSTLSLNVGGTYTLAKTITPSDATNQNVVWSTNNIAVATVDSNGKVTAVSKGAATITCTSSANSSISGACAVTVVQQTTGISICPTSMELTLGRSDTPVNLFDFSKWVSNGLSASSGTVNTSSCGFTITSTANDTYLSHYHMTTSPSTSQMALIDNYGLSVSANTQYTVACEVTQNSANNSDVFIFWYDSNKAYISLNSASKTGNGTLSLTATSPSNATYCIFRFDNNVSGYTNLYSNIRFVEGSDASLGSTGNIHAQVLPSNANNQNYTLTSSNTGVATVSNGIITAIGVGTCTITATSSDGGHTATCTIIVVSPGIFKIANGSIIIENMILGSTTIKSAYIGSTQIFKKD